MKSVTFRLQEEIYLKLRMTALKRGKSVREVLTEMIEAYLKKGVKAA